MLRPATLRLRAAAAAPSRVALAARRTYASKQPSPSVDSIPANDPNPKTPAPNVSATNAVPTSSGGSSDQALQESVAEAEAMRTAQAPNRSAVWSRSQNPRERAMAGPRFEQTIMADQPRPLAAIDLIHKQPVRWVKERKASCDGGGGPLGHPRIFINVDKPKICWCTYCGVPFAHEHHRKTIEASDQQSYPLDPTGQEGEVQFSQQVTDKPLEQR
ncbi:nadh-ubiquinone oxidoreductase [Neofusicoccum parvum]|uniref:Putative nadh-ubiquinone oxidoreductase protein n=1 Tax=Botryosphaeria parva (strain UCR-NP2) TaxID=1287680 RepID=R1GHU5_BOTPV|nr:putative nadh-ubiquinone oxidoreductase protein [Neofusicoccum parvum UCRNP2]GME60564.1 nadh-ubiquinone oxidoreductase [Neofusicoccum parvum]